LCLVVVGIVVAAHAFWLSQRATETEIEQGLALLGRLESAMADVGALVKDTIPGPETADLMVAEESEGLAVAALQARLSDLARSAGLRIESAGGLPVREVGPLTLIGLRIEVGGGDEAVGRLLHGIETARPVLLIEGARLRSAAVGSGQGVEASLDIYAALGTARTDQP
jgi:hypothetical protein